MRPKRTSDVRVLIIRGSGGAFAAGTDISQFRDYDGEDGVAYEQRLDAFVDRLERLPFITIAEVDGVAVGGGCAIAPPATFASARIAQGSASRWRARSAIACRSPIRRGLLT